MRNPLLFLLLLVLVPGAVHAANIYDRPLLEQPTDAARFYIYDPVTHTDRNITYGTLKQIGGPPGPAGLSLNWRDEWQPYPTSYSANSYDAVYRLGSSYRCVQDNSGIDPATDTVGVYWLPIAVKGRDGADGAPGAPGTPGVKGDKGDKGDQGIQGVKGDQGIQGIQGVTGSTGLKGDKGDTGPAGAGLVPGGTTGQVAAKKSNTDYDTQWVTLGGAASLNVGTGPNTVAAGNDARITGAASDSTVVHKTGQETVTGTKIFTPPDNDPLQPVLFTTNAANTEAKVVVWRDGKVTASKFDGDGSGLTGVLQPASVVDNLTSTSPTAPLSANQGKVLKTQLDAQSAGAAAGATALQPTELPVYYAKKMGVLCNGSADDTSAIDTATTAIKNAGGGTLVLPVGTCVASSVKLKQYVTIQGQGMNDETILKLKDGTNSDFITKETTSTIGWALTNLKVDGNKTNNTTGDAIRIINTGGTDALGGRSLQWIEKVFVRDGAGDGIHIEGVLYRGVQILNSLSQNNGGRGYYADNANDNIITNFWTHSNGKAGIYLKNTTNARLNMVKGWNNNKTKTDRAGMEFVALGGQSGYVKLTGVVSQETNDDYAFWFDGVSSYHGDIQSGNSNTYNGNVGTSNGAMFKNCTYVNLKSILSLGAGGIIDGSTTTANVIDGGDHVTLDILAAPFSTYGHTGTVIPYSTANGPANLSLTVNGVPQAATSSALGAVTVSGTQTKVASVGFSTPASPKCVEVDANGNLQIAGANAACGSGGSGMSALTGDVTASGSGSVTATVIPASTSQAGKVQLTDSVVSTSTTTAATPNSVKIVYDLANGKQSPLVNSSGLAAAISDETGSGSVVFSDSPAFTTKITTPAIAPAADSSTAIQVMKADGITPVLNVDTSVSGMTLIGSTTSYNCDSYSDTNSPAFAGRAAKGTAAAPRRSVLGARIGFLSFRGAYAADDATNASFNSSARAALGAYASESHTSTAQGTYWTFETTATGGTSRTAKFLLGNGFIAKPGVTIADDPGAGNIAASGLVVESGATATGSAFAPAAPFAALYSYTLNANATLTLPTTGVPAGVVTLNFNLTGAAAYTMTWAGGTRHLIGTHPTAITAGKENWYSATTRDQGANWSVFYAGVEQ